MAPEYVVKARNAWAALKSDLIDARESRNLSAAESRWLYEQGWAAFVAQMTNYTNGDCED